MNCTIEVPMQRSGPITTTQRIGAIDVEDGVDVYYLVTASAVSPLLHHHISSNFSALVHCDGTDFCHQITVQRQRYSTTKFICIAHFRRDE